MKRKKIGQILIELGHTDELTVHKFIQLQVLKHPRPLLGELLLDSGVISWEQLKEGLISQGTYELAQG